MSQESDIENNKIVVGIRFVKKNRVIHMEIEQATALGEGDILQESREWVEPPTLDVNNDTTSQQIMTMTYEQRALDIDKLEAPPGYVITGIRFRNLGGHINLEIRVTPIRFKTGHLVTERTVWMGNDYTPATFPMRTKYDIPNPDIPTNYMGSSNIDTTTNQYLMFGATSAQKDVSLKYVKIFLLSNCTIISQYSHWLIKVLCDWCSVTTNNTCVSMTIKL